MESVSFSIYLLNYRKIFNPTMKCDISVKVKELGDVQGIFVKATKNSIYLKHAIFNKAITTVIEAVKIQRQYIVSFARLQEPNFEEFSDLELDHVVQMNHRIYSAEASKIIERRGKSNEPKTPEDQASHVSVKKLIKDFEIQGENKTDSIETSRMEKKSVGRKTGKQEWNQFEANEKLFGIKSDFDINVYASPIDISSKDYKKNLERSTRIANEIMSLKTDDPHRLEERCASKSAEKDDEALYSTVQPSNNWSEEPKKEERLARSITKENEELIKEEEKIKEHIGVNGEAMWSNIASFLTKKNQITNKLTNEHENALKKSNVPKNDTPSKSPTDEKSSNDRNGKQSGKHSRAEKSAAKQFNKDGFTRSKGNQQGFKKHDSSTDHKQPPKIVTADNSMKFKTTAEMVKSIQSNFSILSEAERSRSWTGTCSYSEKVQQIKSQVYIFPSEARIAEISASMNIRIQK